MIKLGKVSEETRVAKFGPPTEPLAQPEFIV